MTDITTGPVAAVRDDERQRRLVTPESAAPRLRPRRPVTAPDRHQGKDDHTRKMMAGRFMTLDGVVESPERWQDPHFDQEMAAVLTRQLTEADNLPLGHRTYEIFARYWPAQAGTGNPITDRLNTMPKLVISTTATTVD